MPLQEEINKENEASKKRQQASRETRSQLKDLRKGERAALSGARGTSERRAIKGAYSERRGQITDIGTEPTIAANQDGAANDTGQQGVDSSTEHSSGGGGGGDGETFELDVVKGDNTAGTASFTGEGII